VAVPSAADEPAGDTVWYQIVTDQGTQIGHASEEVAQISDGREIIETQEVDVEELPPPLAVMSRSSVPKRDNQVWRTIVREDSQGRTVSITATTQTGQDWSRTNARIEGDIAQVTRETPAEKRTISVMLPANVRFDSGQGLLPAWNPTTTPQLEFDNFNIDAMAVEHVVIEAVHDTTPRENGDMTALRKRYDGGELRSISRLLLDRDRRIVEAVQPMFGTSLTVRRTDRATALSPHWPYRILPKVMMKSPFVIGASAMHGHIRYRFAFRDGIQFVLPQTGEQRATAAPGFTTLDICSDCGPGLPTDSATLADALKATAWLQSDHPKLKAIADPVAKLPISDARKMDLLLQAAKPYLRKVDFTGHYSALETLSRRSGDCTEAAVLLAALGRAAGIPTRVADGLVYSRESYHGVSNAFMPHSWTLAFVDGNWRSFDLALDSFDSTHIALTIGDGDERSLSAAAQLASLLRWEDMAEVRTRPGG
jgi:hypothetical protein